MAMIVNRRNLLSSALALGATLPLLTPRALLAQSPDDPLLRFVHPELRAFAAQMLPYFRNPVPLSRTTLAQTRNSMKARIPAPLPDVSHERRRIAGTNGQPEVIVHVINAKAVGRRPAILHTHGGGFVMGTAEASIRSLQDICTALDCVAVTVDYRLAPESTYADSIEDNYAGLKWLHRNAEQLGVDPARIAVMGESAGGGHAALLAIAARDKGEVPLAFQCLIYPMLDDRTGSSRQIPSHIGQLGWTSASNRFGWESLLGTRPGGRTVPKGAVPARVADLSGLPPAFIGVGSIDLFCDEDIDYAQRLNAAGVPVELIVVPGAFHGFDNMPTPSKIVQWFNAEKLNALRRGLGIA